MHMKPPLESLEERKANIRALGRADARAAQITNDERTARNMSSRMDLQHLEGDQVNEAIAASRVDEDIQQQEEVRQLQHYKTMKLQQHSAARRIQLCSRRFASRRALPESQQVTPLEPIIEELFCNLCGQPGALDEKGVCEACVMASHLQLQSLLGEANVFESARQCS